MFSVLSVDSPSLSLSLSLLSVDVFLSTEDTEDTENLTCQCFPWTDFSTEACSSYDKSFDGGFWMAAEIDQQAKLLSGCLEVV